jgi:hypothetical protein
MFAGSRTSTEWFVIVVTFLSYEGMLDVTHVQADEIREKGRNMIVWMGLALMVSTRLWLGGVVSMHRDRS